MGESETVGVVLSLRVGVPVQDTVAAAAAVEAVGVEEGVEVLLLVPDCDPEGELVGVGVEDVDEDMGEEVGEDIKEEVREDVNEGVGEEVGEGERATVEGGVGVLLPLAPGLIVCEGEEGGEGVEEVVLMPVPVPVSVPVAAKAEVVGEMVVEEEGEKEGRAARAGEGVGVGDEVSVEDGV